MAFPVIPFGFNAASKLSETDVYTLKHSARFGWSPVGYRSGFNFGQFAHVAYQSPVPYDHNQARLRFTVPGLSANPQVIAASKTISFACWLKLGQITRHRATNAPWELAPFDRTLLSSSDNLSSIVLTPDETMSNNALRLTITKNGQIALRTYGIFYDPTAWYHLLFVFDTTQLLAADRLKIYVNGSPIIFFKEDNRGFFNLDSALPWAVNSANTIGETLDGWLADIHWIDSYSAVPDNFGFTHPATKRWVAKKFQRSDSEQAKPFGTFGWRVGFDDVSSLAKAFGRDYIYNYQSVYYSIDTPTTFPTSSPYSPAQVGPWAPSGWWAIDDGPYQIENYAASYKDAPNGGIPNTSTLDPYTVVTLLMAPLGPLEYRYRFSARKPPQGSISMHDGILGYSFINKWFIVCSNPIRRPAQSSFGIYAKTGWDTYGSMNVKIWVRLNGSTIFKVPRTVYEEGSQWFDFPFIGTVNKIEIGYFPDVAGNFASEYFAANMYSVSGFRIDQAQITSSPEPSFSTDTPTNSRQLDTNLGREISSNYPKLNPLSANPSSNAILSTFRLPGYNPNDPNQNYKWFFEVNCIRDPNDQKTSAYGTGLYNQFSGLTACVGLINPENIFNWGYNAGNSFFVANNGFFSNYSFGSSGRLSLTNGSYIGFAVDRLANTVQLYVNGQLAQTITLGRPSNNEYFVFRAYHTPPNFLGPGHDDMVINFGDTKFRYPGPAGYKTLNSVNLSFTEPVESSGAFIGNGSFDGPVVFTNSAPEILVINGNTVNFLQESSPVQRLANGFKIRSPSSLYNMPNVLNYYTVSKAGPKFKHGRAAVTVP